MDTLFDLTLSIAWIHLTRLHTIKLLIPRVVFVPAIAIQRRTRQGRRRGRSGRAGQVVAAHHEGHAFLLNLVVVEGPARDGKRHGNRHLRNELGLEVVLLVHELNLLFDRGLLPPQGRRHQDHDRGDGDDGHVPVEP